MTEPRPNYDRSFWEQMWQRALREHPDQVAQRRPSPHLVAAVGDLPPGRALDAGCGHGVDAIWLAAHGWRVTALDFSTSALAHGRSMAAALGPEVATRIEWVEGELATWTAPPDSHELVVCLYVHIAGSVEAMVRELASAVAVGGTLLMVGHHAPDPASRSTMAVPDQQQVSVAGAVAALDARRWQWLAAEERPRAIAGTGIDAVLCARRLS